MGNCAFINQIMEELPLIDTVYQAIDTLYNNPDCQKKNEANRWLIDLQKSVSSNFFTLGLRK